MSATLYHYDAQGIYAGQSQARESPREPGKYLIPFGATPVAPPEVGEHQAAVYAYDLDDWHLVADWRGTDYWDADGVQHTITEVGETVPEGASLTEPPPPPPPLPTVVTMRQARLALLGAGLLSQVNAAVAGMPGDAGEAARIEWEFAGTVERNSALVQSLTGALGLTEDQLDALFVSAAAL
jgi:hypothetical protein